MENQALGGASASARFDDYQWTVYRWQWFLVLWQRHAPNALKRLRPVPRASMKEPRVSALGPDGAERRDLIRYARRYASAADAEDIAHEALYRLLQRPTPPSSRRGFLFQIVRNLLIDKFRKEKIQERVHTTLSRTAAFADNASPENAFELQQELQSAQDMLARMPERQRKIFVLQAVQGYTYTEIAKELGVSLVIVRKDLLKAFKECAEHAQTRREQPLSKAPRRKHRIVRGE